jgi:hypothetical protein
MALSGNDFGMGVLFRKGWRGGKEISEFLIQNGKDLWHLPGYLAWQREKRP